MEQLFSSKIQEIDWFFMQIWIRMEEKKRSYASRDVMPVSDGSIEKHHKCRYGSMEASAEFESRGTAMVLDMLEFELLISAGTSKYGIVSYIEGWL